MDYEQIFDQSFERCREQSDPGSFFESFYSRYLAADPRITELFRDTNIEHQQKMLEKSLYRLLVFYATNSTSNYLETIANHHNRQHYNISPDLYDIWLETLMTTVADYDQLFDDSINLAWRLVLSPGITYMKFNYDL